VTEGALDESIFDDAVPVSLEEVFPNACKPFEEVSLIKGTVVLARFGNPSPGWFQGTIDRVDDSRRILKYDVLFADGLVENVNLAKRNYGAERSWVCIS
jgi:hypothetical protein